MKVFNEMLMAISDVTRTHGEGSILDGLVSVHCFKVSEWYYF